MSEREQKVRAKARSIEVIGVLWPETLVEYDCPCGAHLVAAWLPAKCPQCGEVRR